METTQVSRVLLLILLSSACDIFRLVDRHVLCKLVDVLTKRGYDVTVFVRILPAFIHPWRNDGYYANIGSSKPSDTGEHSNPDTQRLFEFSLQS